jgi:hypothetical protein
MRREAIPVSLASAPSATPWLRFAAAVLACAREDEIAREAVRRARRAEQAEADLWLRGYSAGRGESLGQRRARPPVLALDTVTENLSGPDGQGADLPVIDKVDVLVGTSSARTSSASKKASLRAGPERAR